MLIKKNQNMLLQKVVKCWHLQSVQQIVVFIGRKIVLGLVPVTSADYLKVVCLLHVSHQLYLRKNLLLKK